MSAREPHGFAIIPFGPDGFPTGVALWERSAVDATRVLFETQKTGRAHLCQLYRPIPVEGKDEAPCPQKSSSDT